jgi:nitrite reductase (NADH) small subunit
LEARVANSEEIPENRFAIFKVDGVEIGIMRSEGELFAVRNICPHALAPICRGRVRGTMLPTDTVEYHFVMRNRVLVCPWHGYEYSLESGHCLFTDVKGRLRMYPATERDGGVYVDLAVRV